MPQVTAKNAMHAALQRLCARDGYVAVQTLLDRVGAINVNHVDDAAFDQVMAACPPLPQGQGLMVCTGGSDKPASATDVLTAAALDQNEKSQLGAGIKDDLKSVLDGKGGFDAAARVIHARNRDRAALASKRK